MCKVFVDVVPTIQIIGGMVHVVRPDGECEVWPVSVFTAFLGEGMRSVRDFHAAVEEPIRMRALAG